MNEIDKFLRTLSSKELEAILLVIQEIKRDYRSVPGVKALQGMKGWFRIRMGRYRIIFKVDSKTKQTEIRKVTRRNEKTYKRLK